ncbi:hypothetical protein [Occallatibacter savannae]|uniref:hypothetical protein n=1 Tax=Occallatibacter savannae TaxID=1002691 RepID=UPI000D690DAC|nr:hypothetical protein [Occallatibacter savannae]
MYENEQAWEGSASENSNQVRSGAKESLFKRMLRRVFPDQRRQPRYPAPALVGYLGTMKGSRPFAVGDVGLGGFSLVTAERWEPGTEMPVTLERMNVAEGEPEDRFTVQATAVRWTEDGVGFSIVLFEEESNAVFDNPLHAVWASREDMKLFLERLKSPEEMKANGAVSAPTRANEGSLQAAFSARLSPHTAGD